MPGPSLNPGWYRWTVPSGRLIVAYTWHDSPVIAFDVRKHVAEVSHMCPQDLRCERIATRKGKKL